MYWLQGRKSLHSTFSQVLCLICFTPESTFIFKSELTELNYIKYWPFAWGILLKLPIMTNFSAYPSGIRCHVGSINTRFSSCRHTFPFFLTVVPFAFRSDSIVNDKSFSTIRRKNHLLFLSPVCTAAQTTAEVEKKHENDIESWRTLNDWTTDCCSCYRTSAIHLFKQQRAALAAMIVQQHIKCHFNEN